MATSQDKRIAALEQRLNQVEKTALGNDQVVLGEVHKVHNLVSTWTGSQAPLELRARALQMAITASDKVVTAADTKAIVACAKLFEAYLNGPEPKKA